jgi:hypothetical protein
MWLDMLICGEKMVIEWMKNPIKNEDNGEEWKKNGYKL